MLKVWDTVVDGREAKIPIRIYYPTENRIKGVWFITTGVASSLAVLRSLTVNAGS